MTVPLTVLAIGSVFAGWLGVPKLWTAFGENFRGFEHWLEPVFATAAVEAAKEGSTFGLHRVDADVHFHRHCGRRHSDRPLLLPGEARHSRAHRRQVPGLP